MISRLISMIAMQNRLVLAGFKDFISLTHDQVMTVRTQYHIIERYICAYIFELGQLQIHGLDAGRHFQFYDIVPAQSKEGMINLISHRGEQRIGTLRNFPGLAKDFRNPFLTPNEYFWLLLMADYVADLHSEILNTNYEPVSRAPDAISNLLYLVATWKFPETDESRQSSPAQSSVPASPTATDSGESSSSSESSLSQGKAPIPGTGQMELTIDPALLTEGF